MNHLDLDLIDVFEMVLPFFDYDEKKTSFWMLAPNPIFGGISPVDMWNLGQKGKLIDWIEYSIDSC